MPHVLHLLQTPVPDHAVSAIERQSREPGTTLTVVVSEGAEAPLLPPGVRVRRLAEGSSARNPEALTYSELLDLIFSADQVFSW